MTTTKTKNRFKVPDGIPLKAFEDMTIGQIRKLNKQYLELYKKQKK